MAALRNVRLAKHLLAFGIIGLLPDGVFKLGGEADGHGSGKRPYPAQRHAAWRSRRTEARRRCQKQSPLRTLSGRFGAVSNPWTPAVAAGARGRLRFWKIATGIVPG